MRRARREPRPFEEIRRPLALRLAATFVFVACLLAALQFAIVERTQRQRIDALRNEQQQIETELAAVKRITSETEPVVVLENDEGTRVIMDLDTDVAAAPQNSNRTYD